jgi:hypothetical protein
MSRYFNDAGEPLMDASAARLEDELDEMARFEPSEPDEFGPRDAFYEDLYEQQADGNCPGCGETGCDMRIFSERDEYTGEWITYHKEGVKS